MPGLLAADGRLVKRDEVAMPAFWQLTKSANHLLMCARLAKLVALECLGNLDPFTSQRITWFFWVKCHYPLHNNPKPGSCTVILLTSMLGNLSRQAFQACLG